MKLWMRAAHVTLRGALKFKVALILYCHALLYCFVAKETFNFLRLAQPIAINGDLHKDGVFLQVVSSFNLFLFGEFCSPKAGVLLEFRSAEERLVFWAWVGLDAEFDVFSLCVVFVLIQQVESDSVVKRPF